MRWIRSASRSRKTKLEKETEGAERLGAGQRRARHRRHREGIGLVDLGRLRLVLHPAPVQAPCISEEGTGEGELVPASVLFPIVTRDAGPSVLFTQRTAHLKHHPGQVSFPGGRFEAGDASPAHTALREAREEIGLSEARVEIIGYLPEYHTGTGYRVTPVVALVRPPFALRLDPFEVAGVFEVPLAFLLDPANHERHAAFIRGRERRYHAMRYREYFIWGATAGMIMTLYRAMTAA